MKVFQDGKEVKNATVAYYAGGQPHVVNVDGVNYDPAAFELKDEETVTKKTKPAPKTKKQSQKDSEIMTAENTGTVKK